MDWTASIGRPRPVEMEALRLLVVVHRLGRVPDADRGHVVRVLRGERRAQVLEHVAAHPATLAFLLMDLYRRRRDALADQRGVLARRVRWLLANDRRHYHPSRRRGASRLHEAVDAGRIYRFEPYVWHRWDDVLAALACRQLLQVSIGHGEHSLDYGLTSGAAAWLDESVYGNDSDAAFTSQVCTAASDFLPECAADAEGTDEDLSGDDLERRLRGAADRLAHFCQDRGLGAGDDVAASLFQASFRESL